ncbi:MAG: hypothetical protein HZC25_15935 [Rhodospirillales bacterium]|nr:hypothetical protein [Rhodospirillales bacterium]
MGFATLVLAIRVTGGLLGLCVAVAALDALAHDARSNVGRLAFLVQLATAGVLVLAAIRSGRRWNLVGVTIGTILLPALAFEFLTLIGDDAFVSHPTMDRRSKYAVIRDFQARGEMAVPAIFPSLFYEQPLVVDQRALLPLGGLANARSVLCREAGGWASYVSDRYGFHNPDFVWDQSTHMVIVGDSFVHGACLEDEHLFPTMLRQRMPGHLLSWHCWPNFYLG